MSSAFCFLFARSWVTQRWVPLFANEGLAFSFGEDISTETDTYNYLSFVWSINFSSLSCSQWSSWLLHEEKSCQLQRPAIARHLGTTPPPARGGPLPTVSAQSWLQPLLLPALSVSPPRTYRFWDRLQATLTQSLCVCPTSLAPLFLPDCASLAFSRFVWQHR